MFGSRLGLVGISLGLPAQFLRAGSGRFRAGFREEDRFFCFRERGWSVGVCSAVVG
jgi:hypothetical protein